MKNITTLLLIGSALTLGACAQEVHTDTRAQSFRSADANMDQRLSYGEYQSYVKLQGGIGDTREQGVAMNVTKEDQQNPEKTVLLKFQQQDMNRDTFLTHDELNF